MQKDSLVILALFYINNNINCLSWTVFIEINYQLIIVFWKEFSEKFLINIGSNKM